MNEMYKQIEEILPIIPKSTVVGYI